MCPTLCHISVVCHSVPKKYVSCIYFLILWLTNCHILNMCHRVSHQMGKLYSRNQKMYLTLCQISIVCHSVTNKYVNSIYPLLRLTKCHIPNMCHRVPHFIDMYFCRNLKMYLAPRHISIVCYSVPNNDCLLYTSPSPRD